MKRVGLVTYHDSYNYGAALQAYATVAVLKDYHFDVQVINYFPQNIQGFGTVKKTFEETKYKTDNLFKRVVLTAIRIPSYKRLRKTFDSFAKNNLPLTKTYYSCDELINDIPDVDYFCTGSDQVWNNYYTHEWDGVFFLDFVKDSGKCFSLAASFGKEQFSEEDLVYIKKQLMKYDFITVREQSGCEILNSIGFRNASLMLDPTLLVDPALWDSFASDKKKNSPYILVYQLHGDGSAYKKAVEFGRKNGIRVVRINTFYHQIRKQCENIIIPDPHTFVSLFKSADYVFTDSFHGTVFSIIFERKLAVDLPHKFSDRILTLLSSIGANDFVINDVDSWEEQIKNIDYHNIKELLNNLRTEKRKELKKYIDEL